MKLHHADHVHPVQNFLDRMQLNDAEWPNPTQFEKAGCGLVISGALERVWYKC